MSDLDLDWITDIGPRRIQGTNEWHLKDVDYVTISKAEKIEDKLLMLREVVNYLLAKYSQE